MGPFQTCAHPSESLGGGAAALGDQPPLRSFLGESLDAGGDKIFQNFKAPIHKVMVSSQTSSFLVIPARPLRTSFPWAMFHEPLLGGL